MKTTRRSGHVLARGILLTGALAVLVVSLLPVAAYAQDDRESAGFSVFSGRVIFKRYCASCHGKEALGDGNVAQYLKVVPANLTQLTKKYGEFPSEKVHAFIDGQTDVRGHGTREMPVWGDVLQSSLAEPDLSSEEGEERAARMIRQLVMYLESIQADG